MNDAHLHLIVNHFPIVGPILGLLVLMGGIFFKNVPIKNTAYFLFIIASVFAVFSMSTGEGAEEVVENIPGFSKQLVHEHEELAEKLAIILYLLGAVSVFGIISNIKNHPKAVFFSYAIVVIAIVAIFFGTKVGTSGGEIRHTEIRDATVQSININDNQSSTEQQEE